MRVLRFGNIDKACCIGLLGELRSQEKGARLGVMPVNTAPGPHPAGAGLRSTCPISFMVVFATARGAVAGMVRASSAARPAARRLPDLLPDLRSAIL
jgi:hypothetical protein